MNFKLFFQLFIQLIFKINSKYQFLLFPVSIIKPIFYQLIANAEFILNVLYQLSMLYVQSIIREFQNIYI